jgi:hypothetical protein
MLLVAGGQLDPNIGCLLNRILRRGIAFWDILVGPERVPNLSISLLDGTIRIDGELLEPAGCFVRHDVFLEQSSPGWVTGRAALAWYCAIRGWCLAREGVRCFNRQTASQESSKIGNLVAAREVGLKIAETLVTNEFESVLGDGRRGLIQKPVAGGEFTTTLDELLEAPPSGVARHPRFLQARLRRPELRVYRVGSALFGFEIDADDIDYRTRQSARIKATGVPAVIADRLVALCDRLGLDFAAADFMLDDMADLVFLEINTQPMFAAFDELIDGRLCDAIIDHLIPRSIRR